MHRAPGGRQAALEKHVSSLHQVHELLGEAVVQPGFCQAVWEIANRLEGVEVISQLADQLGRVGTALVRIERQHRVELIFARDRSELLAYQMFLSVPQPFAPAGTLHSWAAFVEREITENLPAGTPPVPDLPCVAGAGRAFRIRPGLHISTGYTADPAAQLAALRQQGVMTKDEYEQALRNSM